MTSRGIAARVYGYLKRRSVEQHGLYEYGTWRIQYEHGSEVVHGRFLDAVAYMVSQNGYYDSWVPPTVEQSSNCNNARIYKFTPEPIGKLIRYKAVEKALNAKHEFEEEFHYI